MSEYHEVEVLGSEALCGDIVSVRFKRPQGFEFAAGQWMVVRLPAEEGTLAETFTISSAPGDDYLEMTTRASGSAFKRGLLSLKPRDAVGITGPGGRLILPKGLRKVAFLMGGVGITPGRSMLRDAGQAGHRFEDAVLFYGRRDASCVPFQDEFMRLGDNGVRIVPCYERPPTGWEGETGFITAETVRRHLDPLADERPFVVAGPPLMVQSMLEVLDDLGVPVSRRMIERFGARV